MRHAKFCIGLDNVFDIFRMATNVKFYISHNFENNIYLKTLHTRHPIFVLSVLHEAIPTILYMVLLR